MNTANQQLPSSVYEQMRKNRWRTLYLMVSFPLVILALTYVSFFLFAFFSENLEISPVELANLMMSTYGFWVLIGVAVWSLVSYYAGSRMILGFAGAKAIAKKDAPELYRIVENMSIAAGLPKTPDIYIIEDESLNAFATGRNPKHASVAISRGLLERLDKPELEGVMAHEIGHILNRDIRVMLIMVAVVGAVQMIGEMLIRIRFGGRDSDNKAANFLPLLGFVFITIGVLIGVLTRLAVSREREYLADATGAYLTSNPNALASALNKIAGDARLEVLDKKQSVAGLCIADPTASGHENHQMALGSGEHKTSWWRNLWSSHPPIAERIRKLGEY